MRSLEYGPGARPSQIPAAGAEGAGFEPAVRVNGLRFSRTPFRPRIRRRCARWPPWKDRGERSCWSPRVRPPLLSRPLSEETVEQITRPLELAGQRVRVAPQRDRRRARLVLGRLVSHQ